MRFDNSLNIFNLPENKFDVSSIDYDVFSTNYNNYKLTPENDGVYLEDDNNAKVYKLEENNGRVYVQKINHKKLSGWFDMARFDGLNKDIYTRVNCLGDDLFIEEYTTSNENMLSLSIYKDVRAYLTNKFGEITCDTFDKIPEVLEALSIVPDAQIMVEYKPDAKRDVYTVRSYVDGMRLLDNNSMFCPTYELDEHYAKASGYAKAKYSELIKPLLELPIEFRQIEMAKLDNKEFKI